jgi:hypothetical protein
MAHASRVAHVYFRMRKTILDVCNSINSHLLIHWCNCRKLTYFPGSAHTWLLLNDLVIEQRRALLLYKDKTKIAASNKLLVHATGQRACHKFAITASMESVSCMNKLNPSNLLALALIKRSGGGDFNLHT